MEIGLVSDVHANLPALEAVLEDLPEVDRVVCAGDVVGYNAWPAECLDRVREAAAVTVQGNHDRNVETPERYRANHMAHAGLELAREQLDDEDRKWLASLPPRTEFADGDYLLVHSHPVPDRQGRYVYPDQFSDLGEHLDGGDYSGIVLGHTHVQHLERVGDGFVVNPGSVGQPRDGDPRAGYAALDTETNAVDLHRVEYDVERAQAGNREAGLPGRTANRLADGQ